MRIAVIDNDPKQRALINEILRGAHHISTSFSSLEKLVSDPGSDVELLVYHWQPIAHGAGPHPLEALRQARPLLPVLVVTDQASDQALADWLNDPRTDYLVCPVRSQDLLLRVKLWHMRLWPHPEQPAPLQFGVYSFDPHNATAWHRDKLIRLTRKEFLLAFLLFRHLGRPLSRATIHEAVWPKEAEFNSRSLDTHIARIRQKFGLQPEHGYRLLTVYGYGYQLEPVEFPGQNPVTPQV
jgi:DNA-binding response OmpR family regulator